MKNKSKRIIAIVSISFSLMLLIFFIQPLQFRPSAKSTNPSNHYNSLTPNSTPTISQITFVEVPNPQKDVWDKISSISGLFSGVIIAIIGGFATYFFRSRERIAEETKNKQELAILELQATQGFFPYLLSDKDQEVELALLAISLLGSPKLATNLASYISQFGAKRAFSIIIKTRDPNIPYNIAFFKEIHDIQPNGDLIYERITNIEAFDKPVAYAYLSLGVTQGKLAKDFEIEVMNPQSGNKLIWEIEDNSLKKKFIIALLDPPAIKGRNSLIKFRIQWPGAYSHLVSERVDTARITLDHKVSQLEIVLIAPLGLVINEISFKKLKPKVNITKDDSGRSIAIITDRNVPIGVYLYEISSS